MSKKKKMVEIEMDIHTTDKLYENKIKTIP